MQRKIRALKKPGICLVLMLLLTLCCSVNAFALNEVDVGEDWSLYQDGVKSVYNNVKRLEKYTDAHTLTSDEVKGCVTDMVLDAENSILTLEGFVWSLTDFESTEPYTVKVSVGSELWSFKTIPTDRESRRQTFRIRLAVDKVGAYTVRAFAILPGDPETIARLYFEGEGMAETETVNFIGTASDIRGGLTEVSCYGTEVCVTGWAYDRSEPGKKLTAELRVISPTGNELERQTKLAKQYTNEIGVEGVDRNHGFELEFDTVGRGYLYVEVWACSDGIAGEKRLIGMDRIFASDILYDVESVKVSGAGIPTVKGWVSSPDKSLYGDEGILIHAYYGGLGDGSVLTEFRAGLERSDIRKKYGLSDSFCGFEQILFAPKNSGTYRLIMTIDVPQSLSETESGMTWQILYEDDVKTTPRASKANQEGAELSVTYADGRITVKGYIRDPDDPQIPLRYRVYVGDELHEFRAKEENVKKPKTVNGKTNRSYYNYIEESFPTQKGGAPTVKIVALDSQISSLYGMTLPAGFTMPEEKANEVYVVTLEIDRPLCYLWQEGREAERAGYDDLVKAIYKGGILSQTGGGTYCIKLNRSCDCGGIKVVFNSDLHSVDYGLETDEEQWFRLADYGGRQINMALDLNDCVVKDMDIILGKNQALTVKNGTIEGTRPFIVQNGTLNLENVTLDSCGNDYEAVFNDEYSEDMHILQELFLFASYDYEYGIDGGAVCIDSATGSKGCGGAICQKGGKVILNNCCFKNCYSTDYGGAVYSDSPSALEISNCRFESNHANNGGAIYAKTGHNESGVKCTVIKSSFLRNSAGAGHSVYLDGTMMIAESDFQLSGKSNEYNADIHVADNSLLKLGGKNLMTHSSKYAVYLCSNAKIKDCGMDPESRIGIAGADISIEVYNVAEKNIGCFYATLDGITILTQATSNSDGKYFSASAFSDMEAGAVLSFALVLLPVMTVMTALTKKRKDVTK